MEYDEEIRTARNKTAGTGQTEKKSRNRTARTGQP
jgi:hypothetical protein